VEVAAERAGSAWRISISDNGAGVPAADQERIFEAFQRGQAQLGHAGTGLGLAICQRLAARYGGAVGLESPPGQGARFWVLLPSAPAAA
jgi:signal transduction histidine kinase